MALSARLMLRQGQSLVMTPQLLQAIKLLQLSNLELVSFVEEELERNPLLERVDDQVAGEFGPLSGSVTGPDSGEAAPEHDGLAHEGDWASSQLEIDHHALEANLGTEIGNSFDVEPAAGTARAAEDHGVQDGAWSGPGGQSSGEQSANLEAYVSARPTLNDHLEQQLVLAVVHPTDRMIGKMLIDAIDETGYLREGIGEVAERLGVPQARIARLVAIIQTFDPSGIGAEDLRECLTIQLRERNRLDPAMEALLANLPLLARRDYAGLRKVCGVDDEDLSEMAEEIRRLNPKPGRAFGDAPIQPVIPDVTVTHAADGTWNVELNAQGLPRVLINQTYAARVSKTKGSDIDRSFVASCLQTANWLTKSLEQRAKTILKVSSEIVRQQDGFLAKGIEYLRPLNLKTVADAIGMHESTVSRVTSNKYMATPRGLFELKYFFTVPIAARGGGEAHSAEAVRFRIRQLIDQELPNQILSDDAIVGRLKEANVDIARRTVAKYRDSLHIPSSAERRREKQSRSQRSQQAVHI